MDVIRKRVLVTGRVQGVYYRDSCRAEAVRLGVTGWVRNRGDGSVEVLIEGEPAAVEQLVDWCRRGPPTAVVAGLEIKDEVPRGAEHFRITD